MLVIIVVVGALWVALTGRFFINWTPSIPRGIYWISPGERPGRGELVAFPIPATVRELLYERQYVPRSIKLLAKPVVALGGDHVCLRDRRLFINGVAVRSVLENDLQGRPMPLDRTCRELRHDEIFLVTEHDQSFDSRNFGPVALDSIRGTLTPVLTQ